MSDVTVIIISDAGISGGPDTPAPAIPSGLAGMSDADIAELKRKLDFQANKKRVQEKAKEDREKDAKTLWPLEKYHREFLRGTGRYETEPKHHQVAHLVNHPKFLAQWEVFNLMKAGSPEAGAQLKVCRQTAIEVSLTKEKRQEKHLELERKLKEEKEARKKAKGLLDGKGGSSGSSGGIKARLGKSAAGSSPLPGGVATASASHRHQLRMESQKRQRSSSGSTSAGSTFGLTKPPPSKAGQKTSGVSVHD